MQHGGDEMRRRRRRAPLSNLGCGGESVAAVDPVQPPRTVEARQDAGLGAGGSAQDARPRAIDSPEGVLRAIYDALDGTIGIYGDSIYLHDGGGGAECRVRDEFLATCALPHPTAVLDRLRELDDAITGRHVELWAHSTLCLDAPPYAMLCVRDDTRIHFFVRVEAVGGEPLSWCHPHEGVVGATVSVEAFAWDLRAGWWTIPALDEACFSKILCCAPESDADGLDLIVSGIAGCAAGLALEGRAVRLSITMDARCIFAIRSPSVRRRCLAGAVAAALHRRGALSGLSCRMWSRSAAHLVGVLGGESSSRPLDAPPGPGACAGRAVADGWSDDDGGGEHGGGGGDGSPAPGAVRWEDVDFPCDMALRVKVSSAACAHERCAARRGA